MIKKFGPLVIISILIIGFWVSDFQNYLKIETLLASKSDLLNYINHHYFTSLLIFAVIYIAIVALSLPFASFMTLSAGLLFGWVAGTSIVVFAATMGATIIFLIAKSSFGDILKVRAGKLYKKIQKIIYL